MLIAHDFKMIVTWTTLHLGFLQVWLFAVVGNSYGFLTKIQNWYCWINRALIFYHVEKFLVLTIDGVKPLRPNMCSCSLKQLSKMMVHRFNVCLELFATWSDCHYNNLLCLLLKTSSLKLSLGGTPTPMRKMFGLNFNSFIPKGVKIPYL